MQTISPWKCFEEADRRCDVAKARIAWIAEEADRVLVRSQGAGGA